MIVRKIEHNTYKGVSSLAVLLKFDCTPGGGDPAGVLDNSSGSSCVRTEDMIDRCFDIRRARGIDAGYRQSKLELFFLQRNRR